MNRTNFACISVLHLAILLLAQPVWAAPTPGAGLADHRLSVSVSYALPVTPALELSYWALPQLSLGTEYAAHLFPPLGVESEAGLDLLAHRLSVTARYGFPLGHFEFYGKLKAGLLITSGVINGDKDTRFVFSPLAGALYRFTPALALFAEAGALLDLLAPEHSSFGTTSPELSLGLQARF